LENETGLLHLQILYRQGYYIIYVTKHNVQFNSSYTKLSHDIIAYRGRRVGLGVFQGCAISSSLGAPL